MSDVKWFVVTLVHDISEEHAEAVAQSIGLIKGVIDVAAAEEDPDDKRLEELLLAAMARVSELARDPLQRPEITTLTKAQAVALLALSRLREQVANHEERLRRIDAR